MKHRVVACLGLLAIFQLAASAPLLSTDITVRRTRTLRPSLLDMPAALQVCRALRASYALGPSGCEHC